MVGNISITDMYMSVLSSLLSLIHICIADDLIGVRYRQKFLVQLVAAAMFPLAGLYINDFYGLLGIHLSLIHISNVPINNI